MADEQNTPEYHGQDDSVDERLRASFTRDARDIDDEGFSAAVMGRIRRRRSTRRWILGGASLLGVAFAIRPFASGLNTLIAIAGKYTSGLQESELGSTSAVRPFAEGLNALVNLAGEYSSGLQGIDWTSTTLVAGAGLALLLIPVLKRLLANQLRY